jgi:hypothetical protein
MKKDNTKCQYGGCKCDAIMTLETLWGKSNGELRVCKNHTPEWAKNGEIGLLSPVKTIFGITKSFYSIKSA